ncbi:hypothetical protein FRC04_008294 [Tulasnella sp. 424]|nr:hypothetical protein FRC04_008294 [Tulasnella sp. 424]KAG8970268.1 hypothetical protein FRC05_000642 [Tulasnella sp. 425]
MSSILTNRKPASSKQDPRGPPAVEEQVPKFFVPNITVKDLYSTIPQHCFERSFFRSFLYVLFDGAWLALFVWTALTYIPKINPQNVTLPHPALYKVARGAAWLLYDFCAGLPAMGLWVIAHECGHHAFSTSKTANSVVGWILHSFELGLPPLDRERENLEGTKVSVDLQELFSEALEDAPIVSIFWLTAQLLCGWPLYLIQNVTGQRSYPRFTNHFVPGKPLFAAHHLNEVLISDIGVFIWAASILYSIKVYGFLSVFRIYLLPYLWVNHWLVLITFLQHTDPALPHYQASAFTFPRGALSTFDRELMGGPGIIGSITGWICGTATHGICETHVAHHICSKIPHYHAWEARHAINKRLARDGIYVQGNPATWSEALRVIRECKFVEDEGEVRFYKNAQGKAARVPVFLSETVSDSGIDLQ